MPQRSSCSAVRSFGVVVPPLALWLTTIAVPAGAQVPAASPHVAGDVVIAPATFTTPETGEIKYELGTFYAAENRSDPKSRIIPIAFARFRSTTPTGVPPSFHLPGGPGGSLIGRLRASVNTLAARLQEIEAYRKVSDVVLVDQRGASPGGELIRWEKDLAPEPLDRAGSQARSTGAIIEATRSAVAAFTAKGIDLRGYTALECADDVNDLRRALGYERIMLVATSFGSQWSFAILRRHPEIVARALLSGVEPLDMGYDMPSHVLAAVHRMWWEAEQDERLKPYLPGGGLMGAAREVVHRLMRAPIQVKVSGDAGGQPLMVTLGLEDFQATFLQNLQPAQLLAIYHGHYEKWAVAVAAARRAPRTELALIRPLIDTSLGVTPKRLYLLRADPASEFLGHWNFNSDLATADIWPTADVGDEVRTEVVTTTPTVFVQGDWDTSTPIENTLLIASYFPNSRVVAVSRGPHGVLFPIFRDLPEVMAGLLEYLRTGNMENLPARTALPKTAFEVPDFPPPPTKPSSGR
jgi:pimeloyl-ACP methyl ester carboxylesterase